MPDAQPHAGIRQRIGSTFLASSDIAEAEVVGSKKNGQYEAIRSCFSSPSK